MANITVSASNVTVSQINKGVPAKAALSMTPCFFFLYINVVMLITLRSKAIFRDTSRYILFTNMLFADSLNLVYCMLMYIFAIIRLYMRSIVCALVMLAGAVIALISPLSLAMMALERYIAICFPLRHAEITMCRRTGVAIAIVWALGSVQAFTNLILLLISGPLVSTLDFCSGLSMPGMEAYTDVNNAFTIIYFLSVGLTIVYTYIGIVVAARSASSDKCSAAKAHRTVLLHLIQLGLCLSSILFDSIIALVRAHLDLFAALNVQYVMFLGLIIFPRCLSPLIYGLRDQTFRPLFLYYFSFGFCASN
ncbi:odorant receptor 131-2-like [Conger conger]|uniref:odorant receptor 131-2-like n=1 Tax=Conger conger TaxID=82655 RepID=UPI002A5A3B17|nr:odorant receptor 131-2-like [Conger conger]